MNKKIIIAAITAYFTILSFLYGKEPESVKIGQVENGTYSNDFFGFTVSIPETWTVLSSEETQQSEETGADLIAGDNENMKRALKAKSKTDGTLIQTHKFPVGTPVDFNPGFSITAENVSHAPGVTNGGDYLFHVRNLLKNSKLQIDEIDEKFGSVIINKKLFHTMNLKLNIAGNPVYQTYFVTIIKRYAIGFNITYRNEKDKAELEEILKKTKFSL